MVYESRPGETFVLGASTWRIEDITFQKVTVTPAPGEPGKMPFWHGDRPGRPLELGRALGAFVRELRELPPAEATERLRERLRPRRAGGGQPPAVRHRAGRGHRRRARRPHDRRRALPRRDRRLAGLRPQPVRHARPRAVGDGHRAPAEPTATTCRSSRCGATTASCCACRRPPTSCRSRPCSSSPRTSRRSSSRRCRRRRCSRPRFRECAGRALLLPRRRPDQRTPLWQQRQKAADLLAVAAKYPTFPILLEASRECLQDVFDVPALREVLGQLRSRAVRVVTVDTTKPSPMAQSLLFNWIAAYMYEGDAPLAERRAAALALDRDLLRDLLGAEELRELLDPGVLADVELDLQRLSDGRRARSADELHDVLRRVGDLDRRRARPALRAAPAAAVARTSCWPRSGPSRSPSPARSRFAAADDAARYRDALGCALPLGLPAAFTDPVPRPARGPRRPLRPHPRAVHRARGRRPPRHPRGARARRARRARRPTGASCAASSARGRAARVVRRRGAAPAAAALAGRRCGARSSRSSRRRWPASCRPGTASPPQRRGVDAVVEALGLLAGAPIVASTLESDVLSARVADYRPAQLDELCTSGDVAVGRRRRHRLGRRAGAAVLRRPAAAAGAGLGGAGPAATAPLHDAMRTVLAERGASFWNQLRAAAPGTADDELLAALWDLVWAGEVTNDSLAPLRAVHRARRWPRRPNGRGDRGRPRPGRLNRLGPPAGAGRWSLVAPLLRADADADRGGPRHGAASSSSATAWSPARPCWPRASSVATPRSTASSRCSRSAARCGAGTSSAGSGPPSSPCPAPSTGCAWPASGPTTRSARWSRRRRSCSPPPTRPSRTAPRWRGPSRPGGPARTGAAVVVLRDGAPIVWYDRRSHHLVTFPHTHRRPRRGPRRWPTWSARGRLRRVEVRKVDGEPLASAPLAAAITAAAKAAGFTDGYRGLTFSVR